LIDLYAAPTPNGFKISITLEELELPYRLHLVNLARDDQKSPEFLALNPNGKIPVIRDGDFTLFESGAIMMYLAEKAGGLLPSDRDRRYRVVQWLMFQMGGLGPMMGQANVFLRYFPEKIQPAIDRYQRESKRILTVLDRQLAQDAYLAGEYSIADIANWCWARSYKWSGLSIDDLPHLTAWLDRIKQRPAVQRGLRCMPRPSDAKVVSAGQSMVTR